MTNHNSYVEVIPMGYGGGTYGTGSFSAFTLVLFILLVIILSTGFFF
nr:sporulation protein YjcZ [Cohnella nanjingensis]